MVIYIELLLLTNLMIHLFSIFIIHLFLSVRISKLIVFSCLLDIIYMLLYLYYPDCFLIIKYFWGVILVLLSLKGDVLSYLKAIFMYYGLNFMIGGISTCLKVSGNTAYFVILCIYMIAFIGCYLLHQKKSFTTFYTITFQIGEKLYRFKAFFDTGCQLSYKGKPVIVLNKKSNFNFYTEDFLIINSGTGQRLVKCYLLHNVTINHKKCSCYCVFLDINYEAIIGFNAL